MTESHANSTDTTVEDPFGDNKVEAPEKSATEPDTAQNAAQEADTKAAVSEPKATTTKPAAKKTRSRKGSETSTSSTKQKAKQVSIEDLPTSFAHNEEKHPWVANVVKVRGRGKVAVDLRPQSWVGDSPLQLSLEEVVIIRDLLNEVLDATEDLRG